MTETAFFHVKRTRGGMDGAKWGISDWYEDFEEQIAQALANGKNFRWTTGWYSSKKEVASGNLTNRGDGEILCEAWRSDDFDTEGEGAVTIPFTTDLDVIREALDAALVQADEDRDENALYYGFSVGREDKWELTYLAPRGFGVELDEPPGDNYFQWGWTDADEGEQCPESIPQTVADKLAQWAERWHESSPAKTFTYEEWTIRAW